MTKEQTTTTRRGFLDWLISLGALITGLAVTIPGVMYLWPAARGKGAKRVQVKGAGKLAPGQSMMVQVNGKAAIVVRERSGLKAFSASCTHLGCLVKWVPGKRQFHCPCHAGVFDENGAVVSGPPPTPLPEYKVKKIGAKVFVSLA